MRLGVTLTPGREAESAVAAESLGIPFVHVAGGPGAESVIAASVVAATTSVRVLVSIHIGDENPVTLAEEIVVLDNLSNGRIAVIAETGSLSEDDANEDLTVLRSSWSGRPLAHHGRRWQVPAGLPGHRAPDAVMVTPAPAQLDVPLWVAGDVAVAVGRTLVLPVVVSTISDVDVSSPVAPARVTFAGELTHDRQTVLDWSRAGTTHLLCELAVPSGLDALARWLVPEVGMVGFPRVVAESPLPAPWPLHPADVGDRRGTTERQGPR